MAIKFKPIAKRNPLNPSLEPKYYASVVNRGDLSLRQLSKRIAEISTVSSIDTLAVLEAMLQVIPQELTEGKIVRLGDFGSFRVAVNSEGVDTAEELSSHNIKKVNLHFRAGKEFSNVLKNTTFEKVSEK